MSDSEQLLQLDMKQVRKIMDEYYERDTVTYHDNKRQRDITVLRPSLDGDNALFDPELNPETHIESIIAKHNQEYPESLRWDITIARKSISDINNQISDINKKIQDKQSEKQKYTETAQHLVPQIKEKTNQLLAMFPERLHDSVMDNFTDYNDLLNKLRYNMNFFTKTFSAKSQEQKFNQLYTEIADMLKQINLFTINDIEGETQRNQQSIDLDITHLNSELATLNTELHSTQSKMAHYQEQHDKLSNTLQEDIAQFLYTYDNRKHLRKRIPATLNMQHLEKPVAFFQTITGMEQKEVEALLVHAGLPVVGQNKRQYDDTGGYIVRRTKDIYGGSCLELITPFYSPQHARKNIECLVRYLAEHGAKFEGVVAPATYEQINPAGKTEWSNRRETNALKYLIRRKLEGPGVMSRSQFCNLYEQNDVQATPEYLFRGHTFITSDPQSSYATPTWRTGRTGLVYAASSPSTAANYASNTIGGQQVSGGTMSTESLVQIDGYAVGFVTVFKGSKRNLMFGDMTLEKVNVNKELKANLSGHAWSRETVVSPVNNPVIARYMVVGDKVLLIDENDTDWRMIMDGMAPDLEQTHVRGIPQGFMSSEQRFHGLEFLRRIRRWQQEINENGQVTTYDIPSAGIKAMGFHSSAEQYKDATKQLADRLSCTVSMGDCVAQKTIE